MCSEQINDPPFPPAVPNKHGLVQLIDLQTVIVCFRAVRPNELLVPPASSPSVDDAELFVSVSATVVGITQADVREHAVALGL